MQRLIVAMLSVMALLGAGAACAVEKDNETDNKDTWVNLQGHVAAVNPEGFVLDYSYGTLRVDMSGLESYQNEFTLKKGDKVNITGRVDANFYASKTLEASNLYVSRLGSFFYKTSERSPGGGQWIAGPMVEEGKVTYVGTVRAVNHASQRFVIHAGGKTLLVNTQTLSYDPLDEKGYRQVEKGDRVRVEGRIDGRLEDQGQLKADRVTRLEG